MTKVFVIDIDRCNGCRNCQIACKDEHCGQAWLPYTEEQPLTGHFWMNVGEKTRGKVPVVKISYQPVLCTHCADAPCKKVGGDAITTRDDGLVLIDPTKAKGRKDIVDSCPLGAIYWNEALSIPQKCSGCAHLLDNGWEVPRCVDACSTEALFYIEEDEVDKDKAECLEATSEFGPKVYYYNLPKRFVAGTVFDSKQDEVVIGAQIDLINDGAIVETLFTDDFGDFRFDQIPAGNYTVEVSDTSGNKLTLEADARELDFCFDDIDICLI